MHQEHDPSPLANLATSAWRIGRGLIAGLAVIAALSFVAYAMGRWA